MDENALRSLIARAADSASPPNTVDIERARRVGRRRLRLWRIGVPAAFMSAVAVVVGLVASGTLPVTVGNSHPSPRASGGPPQGTARSGPFNPLVPYAAFGWLPRGYLVSPRPRGQFTQLARTVESFAISDRAATQFVFVFVYPVGQCRLTGIGAGPSPQRGTIGCGLRRPYAPTGFGPVPVTGPMPRVLGGHAYRLGGGKDRGLVLRAAHSWVVIERSAKLTPAKLIRIARNISLGGRQPHLAFPFRLTGLPSRWLVGGTNDGTVGRRLTGFGLFIGPAPYHNQVVVMTTPAQPGGSCGHDKGWQPVTVGGVRGILQTVRSDHYQYLCFHDVDGLAVNISVTRPFGGSPVAAATAPGGVIDVFLHHLQLLGPDPANWTTHPISR